MFKPTFKLPGSYEFSWRTRAGSVQKNSSGVVRDGGKSQEVTSDFSGGRGSTAENATLETKKVGQDVYINVQTLIGSTQKEWILLQPEPGSNVDLAALDQVKAVASGQTPEVAVDALKKAKQWALISNGENGGTYSAVVSRKTLGVILGSADLNTGTESPTFPSSGKKRIPIKLTIDHGQVSLLKIKTISGLVNLAVTAVTNGAVVKRPSSSNTLLAGPTADATLLGAGLRPDNPQQHPPSFAFSRGVAANNRSSSSSYTTLFGNGTNGTELSINGANGGLLIGNGGNGFSPAVGNGGSGGNGGLIGNGGNGGNAGVGGNGGNGGSAGWFGQGGSGGNGGNGTELKQGGTGGNGGNGGLITGNGGNGGTGGEGGTGAAKGGSGGSGGNAGLLSTFGNGGGGGDGGIGGDGASGTDGTSGGGSGGTGSKGGEGGVGGNGGTGSFIFGKGGNGGQGGAGGKGGNGGTGGAGTFPSGVGGQGGNGAVGGEGGSGGKGGTGRILFLFNQNGKIGSSGTTGTAGDGGNGGNGGDGNASSPKGGAGGLGGAAGGTSANSGSQGNPGKDYVAPVSGGGGGGGATFTVTSTASGAFGEPTYTFGGTATGLIMLTSPQATNGAGGYTFNLSFTRQGITQASSYTNFSDLLTISLDAQSNTFSGAAFGGNNSQVNDGLLITGSTSGDTITGSAFDDRFIGRGSADNLTGGLGADRFEYEVVGGVLVSGGDTITDFSVAQNDRIVTSQLTGVTGFIEGTAAVGGETLINAITFGSNANFVSGAGAVALSAEATFAYDTTTNVLSFDADGTGAGATAITIATLSGAPVLTAAQIAIS